MESLTEVVQAEAVAFEEDKSANNDNLPETTAAENASVDLTDNIHETVLEQLSESHVPEPVPDSEPQLQPQTEATPQPQPEEDVVPGTGVEEPSVSQSEEVDEPTVSKTEEVEEPTVSHSEEIAVEAAEENVSADVPTSDASEELAPDEPFNDSTEGQEEPEPMVFAGLTEDEQCAQVPESEKSAEYESENEMEQVQKHLEEQTKLQKSAVAEYSEDHEMYEGQEVVHPHVDTEEVVLNEFGDKENEPRKEISELEHISEEISGKNKSVEEQAFLQLQSLTENGKDDEVMEYDDSSQDEETVVVVASADDRGKEIFLRTADGQELPEGAVTVQEVTDEEGQIYYVETMDDVIVMHNDGSQSGENDDGSEKMMKMPSHVLGRNIENPAVDPFRNGKAPPKPRLGVKIPYRNLTSQIVSKQEITNEILERSKRHLKENPGGQNLFAKKLTQNLAKKLAPQKKPTSTPTVEKEAATSRNTPPPKEKKLNNSDLIAILEGDSDSEGERKPMTKELEREIALKQLSELPDDPPDPKANTSATKVDVRKVSRTPGKPEVVPAPNKVETPVVEKLPEDIATKSKKVKPSEAEETTNAEDLAKPSRFASSVPLKTYTRKRKPSDEAIAPLERPVEKRGNDSTKKIDLPATNNSYVTKSSRIIKKKIIWDPDEVPSRKVLKAMELPQVKEKLANKESSEKKVEKKESPKIVEKKVEEAKKVEKFEQPKQRPENLKSPRQEPIKVTRKVFVKLTKDSPKLKEVEIKASNDKLAALKIKKRLTEVDKLLMDEGAVNMLYSFKTDDDQAKKPNKSLMSKTNELLNDLHTSSDKVSPKALRKKEGLPTVAVMKSPKKASPSPSAVSVRQKSRDSNRSSIHSPPPSPGQGFPADASRIIRRHSSSSFSSMDEDDEKAKLKRNKKKQQELSSAAEESPRKKLKRDEAVTKVEVAVKASPKAPVPTANPSKYSDYKTFKVHQDKNLVKIELLAAKEEDVYISNEMMQELISILNELKDCEDCNVVVVTSNGRSFSSGINFKTLVAQKEIAKKNLAKKLATNIRDFLLALANFPKVIIAGVHGDTVGLGVTMLPLFDIIIATETAKFSTPYACLGCIAEGGSLLSLPHLTQNVLVSELLYSSRILCSNDALKLGLLTRTVETEKFNSELSSTLKDLTSQSSQFMEGTKRQMRNRIIPQITEALNSETEMLVQQWTSAECQRSFSLKYNI